jgi:hypothetical protein
MASGQALLQVGHTSLADLEHGISGPSAFGTGGPNPIDQIPSTSQSGDFTGIDGSEGILEVPHDYVSGSQLSGTATWANSTFSSLQLTPGTYTWTWGSGTNADSFVINIGPTVTTAPEPASLTLLGFGTMSLMGYGWRRRGRVPA